MMKNALLVVLLIVAAVAGWRVYSHVRPAPAPAVTAPVPLPRARPPEAKPGKSGKPSKSNHKRKGAKPQRVAAVPTHAGGYSCADVRWAVQRFGRTQLEAMARAQGATPAQRRQARACL